jgi:ATP-dependent RNA helicase DHX37/DHR1
MPLEGVVLQMKSMHIDAVVNFPFPTPPDQFALKQAETALTHLGALRVSPAVNKGSKEVLTTATIGGHITDLGKTMSLFPLSPRFSRMLVGGRHHGCLPYVVSIVSALSIGDPFIREDGIEDEREELDEEAEEALSHLHNEVVKAKEARKLRRQAFFRSQQVRLALVLLPGAAPQICLQTHGSLGNATSDMFRLLSIVGAYEYAGGGHMFCSEHFVRPKVSNK